MAGIRPPRVGEMQENLFLIGADRSIGELA
jgi:hypothetical protein